MINENRKKHILYFEKNNVQNLIQDSIRLYITDINSFYIKFFFNSKLLYNNTLSLL